MAYYKVLLEVWCNWDLGESDLEEPVQPVGLGEDVICTLRTVVKVCQSALTVRGGQAIL